MSPSIVKGMCVRVCVCAQSCSLNLIPIIENFQFYVYLGSFLLGFNRQLEPSRNDLRYLVYVIMGKPFKDHGHHKPKPSEWVYTFCSTREYIQHFFNWITIVTYT